MKPETVRAAAAVLVSVVVFGAVLFARAPVGAGTYYDDGVYLALAESLAKRGEYDYANLPGTYPGVKYPPFYPVVLAAGWRVFGGYPANLDALKTLNALFYGVGAGLVFLLFATGGRRRVIATAGLTVGAFLWVPGMSIATVLMSEPLFLVLSALALLVVRRALRTGDAFTASRAAAGDGYSSRTSIVLPRQRGAGSDAPGAGETIFGWAAAGLLASLAFLTRSIGIALIAAVLVTAWVRHHRRSALIAAAAAAAMSAPWIVWSAARISAIPPAVLGHYGPYTEWYREGLAAGGPAFIWETAVTKFAPLVETLAFAWFPGGPRAATLFVVVLLSGLAVLGGRAVWKRSPAIPLFVLFYLLVVFLWPFEPYRFYYMIGPFLTLLVAEGAFSLLAEGRAGVPAFARPVGLLVATLLVVNAGQYHLRGWINRAWELPQTLPAEAYSPYVAWIELNTKRSDVIAAHFDPYVYWETGRQSVPSAEFRASGFAAGASGASDAGGPTARGDGSPGSSPADELEQIVETFGPRYLILLDAEDVATAGVAGYLERHPDALVEVLRIPAEEGLIAGRIYEIIPPSPQ